MRGGRVFCLVIGAMIMLAIFLAPAEAFAQTFNTRITVYAAVPEQRAIYLNQTGEIIKVAGNTSKNVTPDVYDYKNQLVPMTPSVQTQYQKFLSSHQNHLAASQTYLLNPITVSKQVDNQNIKINTSIDKFSLAL
jgi:hypothetical protein